MREAEICPTEAVHTKRPMTSEKISYYPITEKTANPELIILKTGKVEYRKNDASARRITPRARKHVVASSDSKERPYTPSIAALELGLSTKKLPKVERDNPKGKIVSKSISKGAKHSGSRALVGAKDLDTAEGFPLTVKITPRVHPANERPATMKT